MYTLLSERAELARQRAALRAAQAVQRGSTEPVTLHQRSLLTGLEPTVGQALPLPTQARQAVP